MKKYLYNIVAMVCFIGLYSCGDADVNDTKGSTEPPLQVLNIKVKNLNGGAVIYYDRPKDKNLKYVQAVYTLDDGTQRRFNSSFYTDSVKVDGFPESGEYQVDLYSVSYREIKSDPVSVQVNPLTPAYKEVLNQASVEATFGGFYFTSRDETASDLSIIFVKKVGKEWEEVGAYYTNKMTQLQYILRNQDAIETVFGIYVRDRWGHISDTIAVSLTPWYENEIPKKNPLWKNMKLPGDTWVTHTFGGSNTSLEALWDGTTETINTLFHSKPTDPMPQHFSIDLGKKYVFSRLVVNWRAKVNEYTYVYTATAGMPKTFELWGSNDPNPDGSWGSWNLIGSYLVTRADGTTSTQEASPLTDADKALLKDGSNFDIPVGTPAYRYIRFNTTSTYGSNAVQINELTFWGEENQ